MSKKGGFPDVMASQFAGWLILIIGMLVLTGFAKALDISGSPLRPTLTTQAEIEEKITSPTCYATLAQTVRLGVDGVQVSQQIVRDPEDTDGLIEQTITDYLNQHAKLQFDIQDEEEAYEKWFLTITEADRVIFGPLGGLEQTPEILEKNSCSQQIPRIQGGKLEVTLVLAK